MTQKIDKKIPFIGGNDAFVVMSEQEAEKTNKMALEKFTAIIKELEEENKGLKEKNKELRMENREVRMENKEIKNHNRELLNQREITRYHLKVPVYEKRTRNYYDKIDDVCDKLLAPKTYKRSVLAYWERTGKDYEDYEECKTITRPTRSKSIKISGSIGNESCFTLGMDSMDENSTKLFAPGKHAQFNGRTRSDSIDSNMSDISIE